MTGGYLIRQLTARMGRADTLARVESAAAGFEQLKQVLEDLPIRPEYVVLVGDNESEAVRRSDFSKTAAWLESNLTPVSEAGSFVRVYRQR